MRTDRVEMYRLISKGRHIRRFFPPEAPTPEGWEPYYTDTPKDLSNVKRYIANENSDI